MIPFPLNFEHPSLFQSLLFFFHFLFPWVSFVFNSNLSLSTMRPELDSMSVEWCAVQITIPKLVDFCVPPPLPLFLFPPPLPAPTIATAGCRYHCHLMPPPNSCLFWQRQRQKWQSPQPSIATVDAAAFAAAATAAAAAAPAAAATTSVFANFCCWFK